MSFNGSIIRTRTKEAGLTLGKLADVLGVSRQTVNSWIGGAVPRGLHLVKLCTILNTRPDDFFSGLAENLMSVPLHRTIRGKPVSQAMREESQSLAEQYVNLFRQAPSVSLLPVVRVKKRSTENARIIANWLRDLSGVDSGKPMHYEGAFRLLDKLGIYAIFRTFPGTLQKHSYAFYSKIADQRVVFVNIDTSVLDLIFQILHETVHAVRDEEPAAIDVDEEESFCDMVAELTQFPDFYVENVVRYILEQPKPAIIINRMKEVSEQNSHSLWGIYYRLKHMSQISAELKVGGAATNLSRAFPSLNSIFFKSDDPRNFVDMLIDLSPRFAKLVADQIGHCSIRKFGEWLGLDNSMDSDAVIQEFARRKTPA